MICCPSADYELSNVVDRAQESNPQIMDRLVAAARELLRTREEQL